MKYKLLIIIAATLLIAWCGYTIYKNAQPRPKKAIELNTEPIKATIPTEQPTEPTPEATEQPKQLPTNTTAPVEQKAVTVAVVQPETTQVTQPTTQQPEAKPPNVTVIVGGTNGQYTQLCLAFKRGEAWANSEETRRVCK